MLRAQRRKAAAPGQPSRRDIPLPGSRASSDDVPAGRDASLGRPFVVEEKGMRQQIAVSALVALAGGASCGGTVVFEDEVGVSGDGGGGATSTATSASGPTSSGTSTSSASTSSSGSTSSAGGGPVGPPPPQPTALYVRDLECGREAPVDEAVLELTRVPDSADTIVVAELAFVDECTGAGGQHLLARAVDGAAMMWIGSHACHFFDGDLAGSAIHAGVVRARPDAFEQIPPSVCIEFPGVPGPPSTDVDAMAIAVFASMDDAEAFAAQLP
jgi:hypothetical protein